MWSRLASCVLSSALFSAAALAAERPSVSVAYLGDFATHPGALVGLDAVVLTSERSAHVHALVLAGNVGVYVHARNHTGLLADAEIGYRLTLGSGFLFEAFAGAGYLHTFLGAPTYVVDGEPQKVPVASRPAFMPVVGAGVGWHFDAVAPFVRLESFGQYPFNNNLLPHLALVAGVRF